MGSSFVPSELSCAALYAQLEEAPTITAKRVRLFDAYSRSLAKCVESKCFDVPVIPEYCRTNAHIFYILLKSVEEKVRFETELKKNGISAFSHYCPLHSAPAGLKYGRTGSTMAVTDGAHGVLLRLPIWIGMGAEDLRHVVKTVRSLAADIGSSSEVDDFGDLSGL